MQKNNDTTIAIYAKVQIEDGKPYDMKLKVKGTKDPRYHARQKEQLRKAILYYTDKMLNECFKEEKDD